jgi:hypothetical protein
MIGMGTFVWTAKASLDISTQADASTEKRPSFVV